MACAPLGPTLHEGVLGVAWVANHTGLTDPEAFDEVDAIIGEYVLGEAPISFELIQGLAGIGTYFLDRRRHADVQAVLDHIIERLHQASEPAEYGRTWKTLTRFMDPDLARQAPDGYYAVGMAHGVAGVVSFLAHAVRADVGGGTTRQLLAMGAEWLRAEALANIGRPLPRWVFDEGVRGGGAFAGWCWGSLGVAWSLFQAAEALDNEGVRASAVDLALHVVDAGLKEVRDACLCHGAVGNAHLFLKFFHMTSVERFLSAALDAYRLASRFRTGGKYGGFEFDITNKYRSARGDSPRFLFGAAGVALGLLSASATAEAGWDRLLLLSPS